MLNIGMSEILCFAIIAILVLGPDKLPEAARFAGRAYARVRRYLINLQHEIDRELNLSEFRKEIQDELDRIEALERKVQSQLTELQQATKQPSEPAINTSTAPDITPVSAQTAVEKTSLNLNYVFVADVFIPSVYVLPFTQQYHHQQSLYAVCFYANDAKTQAQPVASTTPNPTLKMAV